MHLFFEYATNVMIDHVTITAPANSPNTDGIDPALAHNVTISNCHIDTGDDNIAIKSGHPQANYPNAGVSGIVIKNCVFGNGHGVSIGSETNGGVQDVLVTDCVFQGTKFGILTALAWRFAIQLSQPVVQRLQPPKGRHSLSSREGV